MGAATETNAIKKIIEERIDDLESAASALLTNDDIADLFGIDRAAFENFIATNIGTRVVINKWRADTKVKVQAQEIEFAKKGSPSAVTNVKEYLNKISCE